MSRKSTRMNTNTGGGSPPGHLFAASEPLLELVAGLRVEDVGLGGPGAAGGEDAVEDLVEFGEGGGVGINAEGDLGIYGHAGVLVAQVEAVVVGVDLEGGAVSGGGKDYFGHVGLEAAATGDVA